MPSLSSIAIRVSNLEAMVDFYSEAFQVEFREVDTYGIHSQFGELDGVTLKFVPIRDDSDFKGYPVHQPGFDQHPGLFDVSSRGFALGEYLQHRHWTPVQYRDHPKWRTRPDRRLGPSRPRERDELDPQ